jgi:hypothetical protein
MTSKTETGFKVVSTYRKTGKTTTLDPNFLDRRAAQSYLNRLEARFGGWYAYAVLDLDAERLANASQSRQDAPGQTQGPGLGLGDTPVPSSASEGKF